MRENKFDSRDRKFMRMALSLAEKNIGLASPNPSVGCIVVQDGTIVGRGWHEYARKDHAEVRALEQAAEMSRNATAYVTLEPCSHYGRTPPCADLLIKRGVRRVVVARIDPFPQVSGRGVDRLLSAGVQVDVGLLSERAGEIIEPFACFVKTGYPLVVSKVGMSLDGKIGTGVKEGQRITSPESLEYGQNLRLQMDAILVGVGTVLSDDPELTYRGPGCKGRPLLRIILDSSLSTPPSARVFRDILRSPVLIFCKRNVSRAQRTTLEKQGAEIISVPLDGGVLDLKAVLKELAKRKVLGLLVEGGSRVHWDFIRRKLIDRFDFIVAPMVLGGGKAVPCVGGDGYAETSSAPRFKIRKIFSVGPDLVLESYPAYSRSIISPWLYQENGASDLRDQAQPSRRK